MIEHKPVGQFCPLCQGEGTPVYNAHDAVFRECSCGVLLCWIWASVEEYESMYESMDYHYDACVQQGLPAQMDRFEEHRIADVCRIKWLQKRLNWQALKVLDVGCSNGAFVHASIYNEPCFMVQGLEPNQKVCQMVIDQYQLPVICGSWENIASKWDLIVANDVIEHLTNPVGFMEKCASHSKYLYIETPDWAHERPTTWKHLKPKEHICLFSERSLVTMGSKCGWNVKEINRPIEGKIAILFERKI